MKGIFHFSISSKIVRVLSCVVCYGRKNDWGLLEVELVFQILVKVDW